MRSADRGTGRGTRRGSTAGRSAPTAYAARSDADPPPGRQLRLLITAGPTREYLDPVRFLSNESSGRMGFAIAEEAILRGHLVTLVYGPVGLPQPVGATPIPVISAAEMLAACRRAWPRHDALIMVAAVADYRPRRRAAHKLKKSATALTLTLEPTEDILATLSRTRRPGQLMIGFALEDRQARRHAADKLARKGLDAIVLNSPAALGARRNAVQVLTADGLWQVWPEAAKEVVAQRLLRLVESLSPRPVRQPSPRRKK